jgi:hypothetical protein
MVFWNVYSHLKIVSDTLLCGKNAYVCIAYLEPEDGRSTVDKNRLTRILDKITGQILEAGGCLLLVRCAGYSGRSWPTFRGAYCLNHQGEQYLKLQKPRSLSTRIHSARIYQNLRSNIPTRCDNPKCHQILLVLGFMMSVLIRWGKHFYNSFWAAGTKILNWRSSYRKL